MLVYYYIISYQWIKVYMVETMDMGMIPLNRGVNGTFKHNHTSKSSTIILTPGFKTLLYTLV